MANYYICFRIKLVIHIKIIEIIVYSELNYGLLPWKWHCKIGYCE